MWQDDELQAVLTGRIAALGQASGLALIAGTIGDGGRRIVAAGAAAPQPRTVFEIGSVTKAFIGLLLADMVFRGEVRLEDPVAGLLPARVVPPPVSGRPITLLDLATHTAGLPFMPAQMPTSSDQLDTYFANHPLQNTPEAGWDYSNLGYWLLGEALAARAGMLLGPLLSARVLMPLGQHHTGFALSATMADNLVAGHDAALQPARPLMDVSGYNLMPAAGGLFSTIDDLLVLPAIALGLARSPLSTAMALSIRPQRRSSANADQALGWTIRKDGIVYRDGGTFGYAACVAWDLNARTGIAILSNQVAGVSDIAFHLLRPEIPLEPPVVVREREIVIAPARLQTYAGRYEAIGEGVFEIILQEGGWLTFTAPDDWGLPTLRLRAADEREFFAAELPLRVHIVDVGPSGPARIDVRPPRGQRMISAHRLP